MSRILLVYHNPLFAHSIRAVLGQHPRHMLVGEIENWARADAEVERLTPDTVIVEEDESQATDEMLRALRAHPIPWRVIAMRLDDTTMHIWSGAWRPLTRSQDLIDALETAPAPPRLPAKRKQAR